MPDLRQIPDEYGLSEDSLRGSTDHILYSKVEVSDKQSDNRNLTRAPLSYHEERALLLTGKLQEDHEVPTLMAPDEPAETPHLPPAPPLGPPPPYTGQTETPL